MTKQKRNEYIQRLEKYLTKKNPNYVKAALELSEMSKRYSDTFSGLDINITWAGNDVAEEARTLVSLLAEGKPLTKADLNGLKDKVISYENRVHSYNSSPAREREREYYAELDHQRYISDHTSINHVTGETSWCPKGPD